MQKIILEDRFTTHQKLILLVSVGAPFILIIFSLLKLALHLNLSFIGYLVLFMFLIIYSFLTSIAFLKRGFIKKDSKLYKGSFFREKLFFKKEIDISHTPKLAVLKFRKSQKLAWFSIAKPDLATDFNCFEINILNDKHTRREAIMDLKNEVNVDYATTFLASNFNLDLEIYSPNFR